MFPLFQVAALQGEDVHPAFFAALARVRHIHENCRSLLRTHHQRAGLELMDLMATYQETAYERLCRQGGAGCWKLGPGTACCEAEGECRARGVIAVGSGRRSRLIWQGSKGEGYAGEVAEANNVSRLGTCRAETAQGCNSKLPTTQAALTSFRF